MVVSEFRRSFKRSLTKRLLVLVDPTLMHEIQSATACADQLLLNGEQMNKKFAICAHCSQVKKFGVNFFQNLVPDLTSLDFLQKE